MIVLGINGGVRLGYQDISATLIRDGQIVAAVEEERLNRIKHSAGQLPQRSIQKVLEIGEISMQDVDYVASHGSTWGTAYESILKDYFKQSFGFCPPIVRVHHHDCHAASAYYPSGFDRAMILTIDTSGDGVAIQLAEGVGSEIIVLERISRPNSLGMFYSMFTQFCGFTRDTDEYKLMGLSAYGDRQKINLDEFLKTDGGIIEFNADYLKTIEPGASQPTRQQMMYSDLLTQKLGPRRLPQQAITPWYQDVAAAAQAKLEEAIVALVKRLHMMTGHRKLCLAGGVALNCVANQQLMNLDFIDDVYIQPAAGDAGISLGAACWVAAQEGQVINTLDTAFLGPSFSNQTIKAQLELCRLDYQICDDPAAFAARKVAENKVVAWFQGRMEFGPRALGARSILANPCMPEMNTLVNQKVKFRETFRPFCPSVLIEETPLYFAGKKSSSPYMTITYEVLPKAAKQIPSVTHVNQTARIQTVRSKQEPLYYRYLQALKNEIGVGVSLNTSLNRSNEPIACSPIDAISIFYGSGMDFLVIGNYYLEK